MDVDEKISQSTHNSWTPTIMSHTNSPEYFTISSVNQYDGETTVLAICEDMDAVMYRLKQCYSSCGDEYRINCYHLTTASQAAEAYNEQIVNRRKYQKENEEKEAKLKELEEIKAMSFDEWEKMEDNRIERDKMMNEDFMEDLIKEDELT